MQYEIDYGMYHSEQGYASNYYDLDGGFGGSCNDSFRIWFFAPEALR